MYDTLLVLHMFSAAALFGTVVVFSAYVLGAPPDTRVLAVANVLWAIGGLGTIVFGIWLSLHVDGYEPWHGWIIGAIVLWAIATELGRRAQVGFTEGATEAERRQANLMHWLRTLAVLGLLYLMIYKPGEDTVVAVFQRDDFALLIHVFGAMVLVGALVLSTSVLLLAARDGTAERARLAFRSLLFGVLPAWVVMRGGAQWIADKEKLEDANLTWLDIGFTTADMGLLLILIAMLLSGLAMRRASRDGRPGGLSTGAGVLSAVMLIAYLVTIWAMSAKPT